MTITTGAWTDEQTAANAFDGCVEHHERSNLLRVYREMRGTLIQPRCCQHDRAVRIDCVLIPTPKFAGWTLGAVGLEFKKSGMKIGKPVSQMLDYSRALWKLPPSGISIALDWVFLWPAEKEHGDLASLFAQQRIGTAFPSYGGVDFFAGEVRIFQLRHDGTYQIGTVAAEVGKAVGAR